MELKAAGPDSLSSTTKAIIGALGGGGLVVAASLLGYKRDALFILLGAVLLILVLLLGFRLILNWRAARKAKPFAQTLTRAAGDVPNAISNPGSRAKLDDLRRSFETGLSRFRAAGKDIYKLPWYLLVGEAGSGKTEAIRHSSIPFPPGLQDQLQGTGGTVNMNWWFTNDAVIVDTAGRYMFDEMRAGSSAEWTEFLRLLASNRSQCPINGLLLVIPANSLILDTADQIESKGGQIAQQLDRIQRVLEVRFPVYIVVTKCDLINGFREFFDSLNNPQLQHQILGWSNPAPLDEKFSPELVDEHLRTVHARLSQRRLGLLLDPVARESEQSKRIDEVDSLYSLPDSFLRMAPRMRRYLEMIFVAGEWSPKPLFLRGIYFTTSMREGQALDAELAELLRVPVESLPEQRMWDRDRAFFLRDLFLKKVFLEKGLVTRAVSTARLQRLRRLTLLIGGFASAVVIVLFTWVGMQKLKQSIQTQSTFWEALADKSDSIDLKIVEPVVAAPVAGRSTTAPAFRSRLDEAMPTLGQDNGTLGDLFQGLETYRQSPIYVHPIFLPAARLIDSSGSLNHKKAEDFGRIYLKNVVEPLLDCTGRKIAKQDPAQWDTSATAALVQLIHCRNGAPILLQPLLRYVVPGGASSARFRDVYGPTLEKATELAKGVPPPPLDQSILADATNRFIAHWNLQLVRTSAPFTTLCTKGEAAAMSNALAELDGVCQDICKNAPHTTADYTQQFKHWRDSWANCLAAQKALDARLNDLAGADAAGTAMAALYASQKRKTIEDAKADFDALLAEFPTPPPNSDSGNDGLASLGRKLAQARDHLAASDDSAAMDQLAKLDSGLLKVCHGPDGKPLRSYALVSRLYQAADSQLPAPELLAGTSPSQANDADDVESRIKVARDGEDALQKLAPDDSSIKSAGRNGAILISALAEPALRYQSAWRRLLKAPATAENVRKAIADSVKQDPLKYRAMMPLKISFVQFPEYEPGFHPQSAAEYLTQLKPLIDSTSLSANPAASSGECAVAAILNADDLNAAGQHCREAAAQYVHAYADYWNRFLPVPILTHKNTNGAVHAIDWQSIRQDLPLSAASADNALDQWSQTLLSLCESLLPLKGLAQPGDVESLQQLAKAAQDADAALKRTADKPFADALRVWQDLGDDPSAARIAILNQTAGDFATTYMLVGVDGNDFITNYWRALTRALLQSMIEAPTDPTAQSLGNFLAKNRGFPIGPIVKEMTQQQIDDLRLLVQSVVLPSPPDPTPGHHAIVAGGRLPGANPLNQKLTELCEGSVPKNDVEAIRRLGLFLDALPTANDQWTCSFALPDDKTQLDLIAKYSKKVVVHGIPQRPSKASLMWQEMQLEVAHAAAGNRVRLDAGRPGAPAKLGDAPYPGGAISLALYEFPADVQVNVDLAPPGAATGDQWECLKFLTANAHRATDDPQGLSQFVELTMTRKGAPYSLWLVLQFKKRLPEYQSTDWPK